MVLIHGLLSIVEEDILNFVEHEQISKKWEYKEEKLSDECYSRQREIQGY